MLGIFLADGAAASSADRGYSLTSLHLPLAALGSLPLAVAPTRTFATNYNCGYRFKSARSSKRIKVNPCHSERSETKSRNLRISSIFAVKLVPRSLELPSLPRDDNFFCSHYVVRADESR